MSIAMYMDTHVHVAITEQLRRRGVDVLTAQDDGCGALDDEELLARSTSLGRVMFTFDIRFKARAEGWQRAGTPFAGLVWGHSSAVRRRRAYDEIVNFIAAGTTPGDIARFQVSPATNTA